MCGFCFYIRLLENASISTRPIASAVTSVSISPIGRGVHSLSLSPTDLEM